MIQFLDIAAKGDSYFCDKIKSLGFKHAFKAGISFGKDDLLIPKTKENLINNTKKQIEEYEKQYSDGLITREKNIIKLLIFGQNVLTQLQMR